MNVVWWSFTDAPARGYWDQYLLDQWFRDADHHVNEIPEDTTAAVLIVPGPTCNDGHELAELIARFDRVALLVSADENLGARPHLLAQDAPTFTHYAIDSSCRAVPIGAAPSTEVDLRDAPTHADKKWVFAGQVTHRRRRQLADALRDIPDGIYLPTNGFAKGVPHRDYIHTLARARLAPCPSGAVSVDSFRVYEALEAGCVPVVDGFTPSGEDRRSFWVDALTDPPFVVVEDWAEFTSVPDPTPAESNRVSGWWAWRRNRIRDEVVAVVDDREDEVAVLMPTSPIRAHPDIAVTLETIASVRRYLPDAEIFLMFDGVHESLTHLAGRYTEYVRRMLRYIHSEDRRISPMLFDGHTHQAEMARVALRSVRQGFVLFVEHDTPLIGDIPIRSLQRAVREPGVNVIRLHSQPYVIDEHRPMLMADEPVDVAGVPLLATRQWSNRPHLTTADWYRWALETYVRPGRRTMIEDVFHGSARAEPLLFGVHIYHPEGGIQRSSHIDGRAGTPPVESER